MFNFLKKKTIAVLGLATVIGGCGIATDDLLAARDACVAHGNEVSTQITGPRTIELKKRGQATFIWIKAEYGADVICKTKPKKRKIISFTVNGTEKVTKTSTENWSY